MRPSLHRSFFLGAAILVCLLLSLFISCALVSSDFVRSPLNTTGSRPFGASSTLKRVNRNKEDTARPVWWKKRSSWTLRGRREAVGWVRARGCASWGVSEAGAINPNESDRSRMHIGQHMSIHAKINNIACRYGTDERDYRYFLKTR